MNDNEAAIKALYNLLTQDSTLQSLMGGSVKLYHVMGKVNAPFPYLVHRLAGQGMSGENPVKPSLYYLDIWDYSDTSSRCWNISERIKKILALAVPYSGDGIRAMRLYEGPSDFIPVEQEGETDSHVWRYGCIYQVRLGVRKD